jgi:hypothetical protein
MPAHSEGQWADTGDLRAGYKQCGPDVETPGPQSSSSPGLLGEQPVAVVTR